VFAALSATQGAAEVVRLARNLGEIGPRLRAEDAELATTRLVSVLGKLSDPDALRTILRGLQAVAPRLAAAGAGKAAERISADLARARIASAIHGLARALNVIAPRLGPGIAAEVAAATAEHVVGALADACRPEDIRDLSGALGELAVLLVPQAGESMLSRLAAARTPVEMLRLASGLAALAPALPPQQAGRVAERIADRLLEPLSRECPVDDLRRSAAAIEVIAHLLPPEPARQVATRLVGLMAGTGDGETLKSLADALGSIPAFLEASTAVELLKFPMSVGPVRASLLESLGGSGAGGSGRGLWPIVQEASRLGISPADLRRPPLRPSR
jgi:hypothetical protein